MGTSLRFLTRQGCHLCEDALQLLRGIPLEIVDVDLDLTLLEQYDERVPVLLDASGDVVLEGRFTEDAVRGLRR